ncbi:MAG: 4'-phosphopantetheinyl transferase family protein, partial [Microbacteriaceae bacterium]
PGCGRLGPVRVAWARGAERRATSRALVAQLLTDTGPPELDIARELVQQCPHCGSLEHGPLRTASGLSVVSVSYAGDLAVAAIASTADAVALGVDVEHDRGPEPMTELAALFAPQAPPGIRDWTMIEAVVKADGRGLRIPPNEVRLGEAGIVLPGSRRATLPGGAPLEVARAPAPAGHLISVAIRPAATGRAPESGR